MMKRIDTKLPGVYIVEPQVFGDQRGYFMETYNKKAFEDIGITAEFVQDNQSYSAQKGILRGIHFQNAPFSRLEVDSIVDAEIVHRPQSAPDFPDVTGDVLLHILNGDQLVAQMVVQFQVFRDDAARFVGFRLHISQDDGVFPAQYGNGDVNAFTVLFHEHFVPFFHQAPGA